MPDLNPLRLLILGGGAVVSEFYVPAIKELNWIEGSLVVDASESSIATVRKADCSVVVHQASFRDYLKNASNGLCQRFDAAITALPNCFHEEAVDMCLQYGLHILCEKPLALTQATCLRLAELAEKANRVLSVGMVRSLLPSVSALRDVLRQGTIGKLVSIDIEDGSPYAWASDSGASFRTENGGVLADMGIHYLDMVESIVGQLKPIKYSDDANGGVEANAEYYLKAELGADVRIALSRTHNYRNTAIFRGELGELVIEKDMFDRCYWKPNEGSYIAELKPIQPFSNPDWLPTLESCFAEQLVRFSQAIRGERNDYVNAKQAARCVGLVEWAYKSRARPKSVAVGDASLENGTVVVTGGTGFIGTNLVGRLSEMGIEEIRVPVRTYRTSAPVARYPIEMQRYDLLDYETVSRVVKGARYIFHLAYGQDGSQSNRITIDGTKNLVEAAIAHQVESVVIASTAGVFGLPEVNGSYVDETWPYLAAYGEYGSSKTEMEKWCLERGKTSQQTRIVILNPTIVYGPWGTTYTQMPVQMAKDGVFCWIQNGSGIVNYNYVDNLVDAMLLAMLNPQAHGERFIINDGWTNWREFLAPLFEKLSTEIPSYTKEELQVINKQPELGLLDIAKAVIANPDFRRTLKRVPVTSYLIENTRKLKPDILNKFRALTGSQSPFHIASNRKKQPIPPDWLADLFGTAQARFSSAKAKRVLGWEPKIVLAEGQQKTISWLEEHHVY